MGKYITVELKEVKPKTKVYSVTTKSKETELGVIKWYPAWRRYCFFPSSEYDTVWDFSCLHEVATFIKDLMDARK